MKIGYIRVSTQEQNTMRQEALMEALGVDEVYIDRMSGKNTNRPELQKMMEYVRKGDTVIVESISRFARNTRDLLELVEQLTAKGVEFVSKKEAIDTTTPTGKFMLTVFGAVAELEREYILQRQREGISIAKEQGMLADCYYFGKGVERDVSKAFERYYHEVLTIQTYGDFYYFGLGVPVDKIRAFEAYEDAAAYDVRAQRMLGNCYYYGHGTKRNVEEAIRWYRKAAMHRDNYSLEMVNLYYTAHEGEEAEKWFETAAKIGGDQYGYASHMREYSKKAE